MNIQIRFLTLLLLVLPLWGCSDFSMGSLTSIGSIGNSQQSDTKKITNNDGVSINAPVVVPPGINERPVKPGQANIQKLPSDIPALSASKGLKIETLFSEPLSDQQARIERVENAHIDFRKEYERLKPSILRLAAIESDLQALMDELNSFVDQQNVNVNMEPTPIAPAQMASVQNDKTLQMKPQAIELQAKALGNQGATLHDIRIGQHSDKIRLVLDVSQKINYNVNIQNRSLIIALGETSPTGNFQRQKNFPKNPLISEYSFRDGMGLEIPLRRETQIIDQRILPPSDQRLLSRLVIDLAL